MSFKVYKHTLPDGRAYIGFTGCDNPNDRWRSGWGYARNKPFFEAIMDYGWRNMDHEILEDGIATQAEARHREAHYILKYETYEKDKGFNVHGKNFNKTLTMYVCRETGDVFPSMAAAGRFCNRTRSAVSVAIKEGRAVAGYHFDKEVYTIN